MRLSFFLVVSLFILLLTSVSAYSYQNESNGFRKYKWGTSYDDMKDNLPQTDGLTVTLGANKEPIHYSSYETKDKLIGDLKVSQIWYLYTPDKKQLYKVSIEVDDNSVEYFEQKIKEKFGNPTSKTTELDNSVVSTWKGTKTNLKFVVYYRKNSKGSTDISRAILSITDAKYKESINTNGF